MSTEPTNDRGLCSESISLLFSPHLFLDRRRGWLTPTYAGCDGRTALLVALGTAVAGDASHAILAGTLACGLVASFASSTHGMAITGCREKNTTEGSEDREGPVHTLSENSSPPRGATGTLSKVNSRNRGAGPAKPRCIPKL